MKRLLAFLALAALLACSGCAADGTASGTIRRVYSSPGIGPVAIVVQLSDGEACFLWTDETSMEPGSSLLEGQFVRVRCCGAVRSWSAPDGQVYPARNLRRVTPAPAG